MKRRGQEILDPVSRVHSHVTINSLTGCWEWNGGNKGEYGGLCVGSRTDGTRDITSLGFW